MVVINESFNKADADTLGPDLTWTELIADIDVVSNEAKTGDAGLTRNTARADTDLATSNHYAVATLVIPVASLSYMGVFARKDGTTTDTNYEVRCSDQAVGNDLWRTSKWVSGVQTTFGTATSVNSVAGDTIRIECEGSTIRRFRNGVLQNSATDSSITGNLRCGITLGASAMRMDVFEAGDLAAATSLAFMMRRPQRTLIVRH